MRMLNGPIIVVGSSSSSDRGHPGCTEMFCYRCRRHYLARTESLNEPEPACTHCGSTFVENTEQSLPMSLLLLDSRLQRMLQELAATTSRLVNMAQEASIQMHEKHNRVDPAPKAVLDSLTEFTVTKSNARSCPSCVICMEEWGEGENKAAGRATRLSCGHMFHLACIKQWLSEHSQCPICRRKVKKVKSKRKRQRFIRAGEAASAAAAANDRSKESEVDITEDDGRIAADTVEDIEASASDHHVDGEADGKCDEINVK